MPIDNQPMPNYCPYCGLGTLISTSDYSIVGHDVLCTECQYSFSIHIKNYKTLEKIGNK